MEVLAAVMSTIATIGTGYFAVQRTREMGRFKVIQREVDWLRSREREHLARIKSLEEQLDINVKERSDLKKEVSKIEDARNRLAVLVNSLMEIIEHSELRGFTCTVIANAQRRIISWPPCAVAMFHWTPEEALGRDVVILIPHHEKQMHTELFSKVIAEAREPRKEPLDAMAIDKEGREFKVRIRLSAWYQDGEMVYAAKITLI